MDNDDKKQLLIDAIKEIKVKSHVEIEVETAWKWAARAIASYLLAKKNSNFTGKLDSFTDGEDYFREAVEHAASSGDPNLVSEILDWVKSAQENAHESILNMEFTRD